MTQTRKIVLLTTLIASMLILTGCDDASGAEVDALQNSVTNLESKVDDLEQKNEELVKRLERLEAILSVSEGVDH